MSELQRERSGRSGSGSVMDGKEYVDSDSDMSIGARSKMTSDGDGNS